MKSHPSLSSTLPSRSKSPPPKPKLVKSLPAPPPVQEDNAAKMKDRTINDNNGQLVTAPILHDAHRGHQDNKSQL